MTDRDLLGGRPDFQYFLDLVPCRTACPVHTNAGRLRPRDRRVGHGARLRSRARPEPARLDLRPHLRASLRDEVPARRHRPADLDPRPEAVADRAPRRREHAGRRRPRRCARWTWPSTKGEGAARVAVVGAGPAGLSCAHDLALLGYRVTLFDAAPVVGGMLYQGVPEYRLPRDLIRAEVDQILSLGVELKLELAARPRLHGRRPAPQRLRGRVPRARRVARPRAEHPRQGSRRRDQRRRLPAEREPRLPRRAGRARDRHRRRQRRDRRRADRPALRRRPRATRRCPREPSSSSRPGATTTRSSTPRGPRCGSARGTCSSSASSRAARCRRIPTKCAKPRKKASRSCRAAAPRRSSGENGHVTGLETLDVASVFDASGRFNPRFVAGQRAAPGRRHDHPGRRPAARHGLPGRRSRDRDHAARPRRGRARARSPRRCRASTAAATWPSGRAS